MIVPKYWAQSTLKDRVKGRRAAVLRFGWSDVSEADAKRHAEERARLAMDQLQRGEAVSRREYKVSYNGAEGVPIREEVLSVHGDVVITRNSYGARCLNTPDVLFADIDYPTPRGFGITVAILVLFCLAAAAVFIATRSALWGGAVLIIALILNGAWVRAGRRIAQRRQGDPAAQALETIRRFVKARPDWNVRVYATPAGLRLMAVHRTFKPDDPEVGECFAALGTDPIYVRMCSRQKCFRARLSPKPWRIGIANHMKPRPGVWPIRPNRIQDRSAWVEQYESVAKAYAACRFLESIGNGRVDPKVKGVWDLHDEMSRSGQALPLA